MTPLMHHTARRIASAISSRGHGHTSLAPLLWAGAAKFGSGSKEVGHAEERNVSGTPGELEPTTVAGVSFPNDIRGTSGLGVGDGLNDHTEKWKSLPGKSPMDYVNVLEPIKVYTNVVTCTGDSTPGLGSPVEHLRLDGSSAENPVMCKYCSLKFYLAHD